MSIEVRGAVEQDADAACQVLRRSIEELCVADHHNDESILLAWLKNKTTENVRAWIASENFTVVALRDSVVCGFAMITGQGEIQLCYASPEVRYRGAGKLMLNALEQQAVGWGLKKVFLTSTLTAKSFYERNGFKSNGSPTASGSGLKNVFPMAKAVGL